MTPSLDTTVPTLNHPMAINYQIRLYANNDCQAQANSAHRIIEQNRLSNINIKNCHWFGTLVPSRVTVVANIRIGDEGVLFIEGTDAKTVDFIKISPYIHPL